ncbi:hypothetical protein [Halobellus ordinarius]|uniref:hypothetical protein n=1 Tax=Halobellus ordinarius TaxID=3075120 RepID=UPI0028803735|nr:hypothetical protein [Halobellus sp. ZY16]
MMEFEIGEEKRDNTLGRRELLLSIIVSFAAGTATAGHRGQEVILGGGGAGGTARSVSAGEVQWILGTSYSAALEEVTQSTAILLVTGGDGWYLVEDDASGVERIPLEIIDMEAIIADTITEVESNVDRYPVLGIARQTGHVEVIEE